MWNGMSICLALSGAIGLACLASASFSDEEKPPPVRIKAEDLCGGNCEIVGRLGKPYGEISKVRAVWEDNNQYAGKGIEHFLRVTHIDGVALKPDQQIVIADYFVEMLKAAMRGKGHPPFHGEVVEGRVFESGGYVRYPDKAIEILGKPLSQDPLGFRFYSFLYFLD